METVTQAITTLPARDAEGFLVDASQWTPEIGRAIAQEIGLTLTPESWTVINAARADFLETKQSPGLRRLSRLTTFPIKEFYTLFPDGPAKKIARAAGIPKPKSCL